MHCSARRRFGGWIALATVVGVGVAPANANATPAPRLIIENGKPSVHAADRGLTVPQLDLAGMLALPKPGSGGAVPFSASPIGATDVLARDIAMSLDPASKALTAQMSLTLRGENGPVAVISIYLDPGLSILGAAAPLTTVETIEQAFGQVKYVSFTMDPPIAQGEERTLTIDYGGTLECSLVQGAGFCDVKLPMGAMMEGSAIPGVIDSSNLGGYNIWGATESLEVSLPSGLDLIAPGDRTVDTDDGTTHLTRWEMPGYHTAGAYLAIVGELDALPVSMSDPPTEVFTAANSPLWGRDIVSWMPPILSFLDDQAGQPLPFGELKVIKLPGQWILPGTAGHGIVLLAESYGGPSARYFEETMAHETAHEWWGILVSPTDFTTSRWLVEGMATLSQIDYASIHFADGLDRDTYLARRYREHMNVLMYLQTAPTPAVVPPVTPELSKSDDTLWAYMRSSAALETLRVIVGDDKFADALRTYADQCAFELCDTDDFKSILEAASGADLTAAFDAYVYAQAFAAPKFRFDRGDTAGEVTLYADNAAGDLPMEIWATLDSGEVVRQSVVLPFGAGTSLSLGGAVRSIRPNPRHDGVIWSESAQLGDVSFDGEVDGLDVIYCAQKLGKAVRPGEGSEGLNFIDLDFDPRCDFDRDSNIGPNDMAVIAEQFGTVKEL